MCGLNNVGKKLLNNSIKIFHWVPLQQARTNFNTETTTGKELQAFKTYINNRTFPTSTHTHSGSLGNDYVLPSDVDIQGL